MPINTGNDQPRGIGTQVLGDLNLDKNYWPSTDMPGARTQVYPEAESMPTYKGSTGENGWEDSGGGSGGAAADAGWGEAPAAGVEFWQISFPAHAWTQKRQVFTRWPSHAQIQCPQQRCGVALAEDSELKLMPNLCRSTPRCSGMSRWLAPIRAVRPPMPDRSQCLAILRPWYMFVVRV